MANYRLEIMFNNDDLQMIFMAKQMVVLIKHLKDASSSQKIAWSCFSPFQKNTIEWSTDYALYASTSSIKEGRPIVKVAEINAHSGTKFQFQNNTFTEVKSDINTMPDSYNLINRETQQKYITAGLAQSINENGIQHINQPINAVIVPINNIATLTPEEKLDLYLDSDVSSSIVLNQIESPKLTITYNEWETTHTVMYDGNIGQFVLVD